MKTLASIFQTASFILIIAITTISGGCTSTDEPSVDALQSQISTRAEKSFSTQILTVQEAVEVAKHKLGYNLYPLMSYKVEYILSQKSVNNDFPSDTIAFVVNFGNQEGYAVIRNDTRTSPVLAYSPTGELEVSDGVIQHPLLSDIEHTMSVSGSSYSCLNPANCVGHTHDLIEKRININVCEEAPFNKIVTKDQPNCKAGTVPTACAVMASYALTDLSYKGYRFNFPSINYCLLQGPGFSPIVTSPQSTNNIFDQTFLYSYEGSVEAFGTLMSKFGSSMGTSYSKENSTTDLLRAYNEMKSIGCELSPYYDKYDRQSIAELMSSGYLILLNIDDIYINDSQSAIIDGGEIIYYGSSAGGICYNLYLLTGGIEQSRQCYCTTEVLEYSTQYKAGAFFGVKIKTN